MQLIEWKLELRGTSSVSETDHFPGMRAGSTVPPGERTAFVVRQELRETSKLGFVRERETRPSFRLMCPPAKSRGPASSRRRITAPPWLRSLRDRSKGLAPLFWTEAAPPR